MCVTYEVSSKPQIYPWLNKDTFRDRIEHYQDVVCKICGAYTTMVQLGRDGWFCPKCKEKIICQD